MLVALAFVPVAIISLLWLALAIRFVRTAPILERLHPPEPARWPAVSVIVPARDERDSIGAAMEKLLAQDYPELEIVLVDDRSTDGTGSIADDLARRDPRVKVLHVRELPDGWLGKLNALQRGVEASRGERLLFLDADIQLAPGTLRKAVAYAEARDLDHLAVLPEMWPTTFLVDAAQGTLLRGFLPIIASVRAVEDPSTGISIGVGAFNLLRRSALDRSPGLEHLRLEVADDVALAQMLKASGARTSFALGMGTVGLHYYPTVPDLVRGAEKAPGALGGGSLWKLAAFVVALLALEVLPYAMLFAAPPVRWVVAVSCFAAVLASGIVAARLRRPILATALIPMGGLVSAVLLTRAGILAVRRGGLCWRDTIYPLAALREGSRLRIFPR